MWLALNDLTNSDIALLECLEFLSEFSCCGRGGGSSSWFLATLTSWSGFLFGLLLFLRCFLLLLLSLLVTFCRCRVSCRSATLFLLGYALRHVVLLVECSKR